MRDYKKIAEHYKRIICNLEMMQVLADKSAGVAKDGVGDLLLRRQLVNVGKKCADLARVTRISWVYCCDNAKDEGVEG